MDCIENNRQQIVDDLEGRKSLELIAAIYELIETGRDVAPYFRASRCRLGVAT